MMSRSIIKDILIYINSNFNDLKFSGKMILNNRKYETKTIYINDKLTDNREYFREYPNLIASEKYWSILEELAIK